MTNNEIIRRLRFTFDLDDTEVIRIFSLANLTPSRAQVCSWLKKDDAEDFLILKDQELAAFLNGFIVDKRGKKDGEEVVNETLLNNNIIFRKLKIALSLKDEDIIDLLQLVDFRIGKAELSAFFRATNHQHYRTCKDQILRNFVHALQLKFRKKD
jgi:uncharacterized protein YehS (DUF1456 family)